MSVKVSVVVPVYNPGRHIDDLIASLHRQDMPAGEYEAIFVDDGSTDDTPARLDALAAEHPHFHVIHQENSGWSGKPRNVGIDNAQGEFILFADNDDWLGDRALTRMYTYARTNDADIVVGKMAGVGRGVPRELFRRNRPAATLAADPLIDSMTPHKMFRKAFLDKHRLRFPEGRRRLEDHVFVIEAYFLARTVSVLADYVCYYHVRRGDSSNAAFQESDPAGYFANLREAVDLVDKHTDPGPLRNRLHRRWLRVEMVERMRGRRLLGQPAGRRKAWLTEMSALIRDRFAPGVAAHMPPTQRVVAGLVVAERLDDLVALASWETSVKAETHLADVSWQDGSCRLTVSAELRHAGGDLTFVADGDRVLLDPPLTGPGREALTAKDLDATSHLARARVDMVLRSRTTAEEFFLPGTSDLERVPVAEGEGRFRAVLHGVGVVDVAAGAVGRPLPPGVWNVVARVICCGWTKDAPIGSPRSADATAHRQPALAGEPPRLVVPYWTTGRGDLAFDVGQTTGRWSDDLAVAAADVDVSRTAGRVRLALPVRLGVVARTGGAVVRLRRTGSGETVECEATLEPRGDSAELRAEVPAAELRSGVWSIALRAPGSAADAFAPVPLQLRVPRTGRRVPVVRTVRGALGASARRRAGVVPAAGRRLSRTPAGRRIVSTGRRLEVLAKRAAASTRRG